MHACKNVSTVYGIRCTCVRILEMLEYIIMYIYVTEGKRRKRERERVRKWRSVIDD